MTLFLSQLWSVLQDERCRAYIHWNEAGDGFVIPNVSDFENNVLPIYYKHNRYSSFLRSLSYYSFAKNPANEYVEYSHPHFRQGHPESLTNIARKPTTSSRHPATMPVGPIPARRSPAASASYSATGGGGGGGGSGASPRGGGGGGPQPSRSSSRPRKRARAGDGAEYTYGVDPYGSISLSLAEDEEGEGEDEYDGYGRLTKPKAYGAGEYNTDVLEDEGQGAGFEYEDEGEGQHATSGSGSGAGGSSGGNPASSRGATGSSNRNRSESLSGLAADVLVSIASKPHPSNGGPGLSGGDASGGSGEGGGVSGVKRPRAPHAHSHTQGSAPREYTGEPGGGSYNNTHPSSHSGGGDSGGGGSGKPSLHVKEGATALRIGALTPSMHDATGFTLPVQPSPIADAIRKGGLVTDMAAPDYGGDPFNMMFARTLQSPALASFLPFMNRVHSLGNLAGAGDGTSGTSGSSTTHTFTPPSNGVAGTGSIHPAAVMGALVGVAAATQAAHNANNANNVSNGFPAMPGGGGMTGGIQRSVSAESVSALISGAPHPSQFTGANNGSGGGGGGASSNTNGGGGEPRTSFTLQHITVPPGGQDTSFGTERSQSLTADWFRSSSPTPHTHDGGQGGMVYFPVPVNIAESVIKTFAALSAMSPSTAAGSSTAASREADASARQAVAAADLAHEYFPLGSPTASAVNKLMSAAPTSSSCEDGGRGEDVRPTLEGGRGEGGNSGNLKDNAAAQRMVAESAVSSFLELDAFRPSPGSGSGAAALPTGTHAIGEPQPPPPQPQQVESAAAI